MNTNQIMAEQLAISSLQKVFAELEECKRLHENAGMTLPPTLMRVYGEDRTSQAAVVFSMIPAPKREHIPPGVMSDWISIQATEATATTVALAILRQESQPIKPKVLAELVIDIIPGTLAGTVYNLGKRLTDDGIIETTPQGLRLLKTNAAGILDGGLLWAPADALQKPDLAVHRREAILHLLRFEVSGLQIVQIVEKLQQCSWVKAPVNKDLLKADMKILEGLNKVKLRGNSRKWEAAVSS